MRELIDELNDICETEVNMPLSSMTTLRIGGYAKYVVYPNSDIALDGVLRLLKLRNVPFKMIGKGSDLLCSDDDYYGVIIRLDRHFNKAYFTDDMVTVQAGCSTIALAYQAMKNGLSGLEWASGIPGTIGGAIFMNAGAYKSSMADIVEEVFVYRNGKLEWMPVEECEFSYRTSIFQKHSDWIVAGCRMRLKDEDPNKIEKLMEDRKQRRLSSQPLEFPSCGSVFRNPEGKNAWECIDGIGYRGKSIGDAYVSDKHCNFIVNKGHATAKDYITLVREIQQKVKELGLWDRVTFTGARMDVNKLFQAMDIFVMPSFFEGIPVVGIEAQAAGLPLLVADTVTTEVDVDMGLVEFLPIDNGVEIWKTAILNKGKNRNRMTPHNRKLALQKKGFTTVGLWEKYYKEVMEYAGGEYE